MEHLRIAAIAAVAARMTKYVPEENGPLAELDTEAVIEAARLLAYCRDRKFPPAEQLARKVAELGGEAFPAGQWQDDEGLRASFEVFRAVAQALEPFWEESTPADETPPEAEAPGAPGEGEGEGEPGAEKPKAKATGKAKPPATRATKSATDSK